MSSVDRDESLEEGEPVFFYEIMRGPIVWRHTNSDRDEEFDGETFVHTAISHGNIKTTGNGDSSDVTITLPRDLPVADNWFPWTPSDVVMVTIRAWHRGEADAIVIWIGRLVQPKFTDNELSLVAEPYMTTGRSIATAPRLQRSCGKTCYMQGEGLCNVDPDDHRVAATVTAIDGFMLTIAEAATFPDGRLVNGVFEWVRADGLTISRTIEMHVGTSVVINYSDTSLDPPVEGSLLPGCKQSYEDCRDYFANELNCGALKYIPLRSPHDGNPVR